MRVNGSTLDMDYGTRRKRRETIKNILISLSAIRDAEQNYLENVPENFQNSESFEIGEAAVDTLDDIIGLLADVY